MLRFVHWKYLRVGKTSTSRLFLASLPCATHAQCVPKPYSGKQEVFSSVVQNLKGPGVSVGLAGIELSLEERPERVLATLRDYEEQNQSAPGSGLRAVGR
jgi:hypothetical protein